MRTARPASISCDVCGVEGPAGPIIALTERPDPTDPPL